MRINNKIKRSLSGERGGKASKERESLGSGSRKGESLFLEKGIDNHRRKKQKENHIILSVGQKIKATENIYPESVDTKKPLHRTDWYSARKSMLWYIIEEVTVNKMGKPKYLCTGNDGEKYIIKQSARHQPLEIFQEDV